jgi:uncharacterized SAM-binding protein YcdF (DUF218 family)
LQSKGFRLCAILFSRYKQNLPDLSYNTMNTLQLLFSRTVAVSLLVLLAVACKSPEKSFEQAASFAPFDAIIVPGVPFDTAWSRTMKGRVLWSYHLYRSGVANNIIYSGSAVYSPYVESRIMAEYAKELGIPSTHIFTEENAEHSTENLAYSLEIARQNGFERVALASDPYQTALLRSFARRRKLPVHFLPMIADTLNEKYAHIEVQIDPTSARVADFVSIKEREGFFKRIMGTMGFNIKSHYAPQELRSEATR